MDASAYVDRGMARQLNGNAGAAMADYDRALALDPNLAAAHNAKAWALFEAGRLNDALAPVERALQLNPKFGEALDTRGHIREARGDLPGALSDYQAALALNPSLKESQIGSARVAAQLRPVVPPAVDADRRVALVIGNSNYVNFPKIPNPRNDAEDLSAALKNLGFDVLLGTDLRRADMEDIFIRFAKKARQSDTALVFYAGHGLQHQGINYLAPVDANIEDETDLRKLVNLQNVIDDLQNAGQVRILIVDACRDNEVVKQLASRLPSTRSAAFSRGLAAVGGADGTLIAFATQPNRVAADGGGRNSPFTQALLKNLPTPGLELRTLMTRVRAEVVKATGGTQRPEVWDSLVGEFAFKTAP
jgi:tetratricopeptide (TPR) repeat protein